MVCSKCGTELKDGATFCHNCGAKVEESQAVVQPSPVQTLPTVNNYVPEKKHVSLGGWLLRYLINLIPCVGSIIFIIMLFVWSFDESYDDTSRNWAKAQLIWLAISIVLGIIIFAVFGTAFYAAMDSLTGTGGYYYYN